MLRKKNRLEFLSVNNSFIFYQMGKGRGFKLRGLDGIYFKSSYFTWLPCYLISLANQAIGSVQSMAVVINVMCIFKDVARVGGSKLLLY